jgi:hypothetical protein
MKYDECLNCNCGFAAGCKYEVKKTRAYVMKKPRDRRGPYRGATRTAMAKIAKRVEVRLNKNLENSR